MPGCSRAIRARSGGGGDLRLFELRPVSGCLSDECPKEESEVFLSLFHPAVPAAQRAEDQPDRGQVSDVRQVPCALSGRGGCAGVAPRARKTVKNALTYDYSYLSALSAPGSSVSSAENAPETETSGRGVVPSAPGSSVSSAENAPESSFRWCAVSSDVPRVLYFAGCMTHLTPRILRSVEVLFRKAGVDWQFLDREAESAAGDR